ncbi:MAG: hypothetical protein IJH37_00540 [Clostridia bacterium]|nr:hypothetical protein [Clostridia bacterium]
MNKYIEPKMKYISFSSEEVVTASTRTAEDKLREQLTGEDYGLGKNDIMTVLW